MHKEQYKTCALVRVAIGRNALQITMCSKLHIKKNLLSKYIKPLAKLTNVYGHCALDITEAQTEYRTPKTVATALVWKKTDCGKQITKMAPIRARQAKRGICFGWMYCLVLDGTLRCDVKEQVCGIREPVDKAV